MLGRLAFLIDSNSKIPQMEDCLSLKYVMIYRPDWWNLLIWINNWKGKWELKLNWSICHFWLTCKNKLGNKSTMVWKKVYNLQTRLVEITEPIKAKIKSLIVGTDFSINDNTEWSQI